MTPTPYNRTGRRTHPRRAIALCLAAYLAIAACLLAAAQPEQCTTPITADSPPQCRQ